MVKGKLRGNVWLGASPKRQAVCNPHSEIVALVTNSDILLIYSISKSDETKSYYQHIEIRQIIEQVL